jgi:hypothetical protein
MCTKNQPNSSFIDKDWADSNALLILPDELLEIIFKSLVINDILNLALADSYFAKFLPDNVYYGRYLGLNLADDDIFDPVKKPNFTGKNNHAFAFSGDFMTSAQTIANTFVERNLDAVDEDGFEDDEFDDNDYRDDYCDTAKTDIYFDNFQNTFY